jgi:hypothetical protein
MLVINIYFNLFIKDCMFTTSITENFEDVAPQNLIDIGHAHGLEEV